MGLQIRKLMVKGIHLSQSIQLQQLINHNSLFLALSHETVWCEIKYLAALNLLSATENTEFESVIEKFFHMWIFVTRIAYQTKNNKLVVRTKSKYYFHSLLSLLNKYENAFVGFMAFMVQVHFMHLPAYFQFGEKKSVSGHSWTRKRFVRTHYENEKFDYGKAVTTKAYIVAVGQIYAENLHFKGHATAKSHYSFSNAISQNVTC